MSEDINIGAITEALNNKVDLPSAPPRGQDEIDYVVDWQAPTADNSYTWYRRYKSGWVEQGGGIAPGTTVTLPVPMVDDNYTLVSSLTDNNSTNPPQWQHLGIARTPTSISLVSNGVKQLWVIHGYAA